MKTQTPITDAAEFPCMTWPSQDHPMVVRAEVARKLEIENMLMKRRIAQLIEHKGYLSGDVILDKMKEEFLSATCETCNGSGTMCISEPDGDAFWTRCAPCKCRRSWKENP